MEKERNRAGDKEKRYDEREIDRKIDKQKIIDKTTVICD